jgi:pimeloyl-ACP methyl ester carboxylesterase
MPDRHVISKDGTRIAYDAAGSGPSVILVGGGLTDRTENAPLVPVLAEHVTVIKYDRRGRGTSGDTAPYTVAREVEDIDALIDAIGGTAHLFGVSSGGALALEAAMAGHGVAKVGVSEIPWNVDMNWPDAWRGYVEQLNRALPVEDRGAAFEAFLRVTGTPDEEIAGMRAAPIWAELEAIADTLAYDAACLGNGQPPIDRLGTIRQPVLVLTGDDRPAEAPRWVHAPRRRCRRDRQGDPRRRARHSHQAVPRTRPRRRRRPIGALLPGLTNVVRSRWRPLVSVREYGLD